MGSPSWARPGAECTRSFHPVLLAVLSPANGALLRHKQIRFLSPAYDLTFAKVAGWTREHQMRVRDRMRDIRESDLFAVAREFGVKRPERIMEEVRDAISAWERHAERFGVPGGVVAQIRKELGARDDLVRG